VQHELVALPAGRAPLNDRASAAAAAGGLALRAALLRTDAEEGEQAPSVLAALATLLRPLALVLPDRFGRLHLPDPLPACALVAHQRASHLGHPAVDGGCLSAVGTLASVSPEVCVRVPLDVYVG